MRNAILNDLLAELEQQQMRNTLEENRRRTEVAKACPEVETLQAERQ